MLIDSGQIFLVLRPFKMSLRRRIAQGMLHYLKPSKASKSWIWTTDANKAFPEGHKTFLKQETQSRIFVLS